MGVSGRLKQSHDLYDDNEGKRIEVKVSLANSPDKKITMDNVLSVVKETGRTLTERAIPFSEWPAYEFQCHLQHIKLDEFDILYYGLFFQDVILIFSIPTGTIPLDPDIHFTDGHNKGNVGEGKIMINKKTLPHHLENYLYKKLTYDDFFTILSDNDTLDRTINMCQSKLMKKLTHTPPSVVNLEECF